MAPLKVYFKSGVGEGSLYGPLFFMNKLIDLTLLLSFWALIISYLGDCDI